VDQCFEEVARLPASNTHGWEEALLMFVKPDFFVLQVTPLTRPNGVTQLQRGIYTREKEQSQVTTSKRPNEVTQLHCN